MMIDYRLHIKWNVYIDRPGISSTRDSMYLYLLPRESSIMQSLQEYIHAILSGYMIYV